VPGSVAVRLLAYLGYDVHTVETGQQAVEAVPRAYCDLVPMDVRMPEMDGYAATAAIRERERAQGDGRHTPIVALTAYALGGDVEKSLAAGMDGHVTKPVTGERLAAAVERWIAPSAREASDQAGFCLCGLAPIA
jgi:CheY-like chemotaxis protein